MREMKKITKKKHPKFERQNIHLKKRVARTGWRKPRGVDNKQRIYRFGFGASPNIGYRNARATRGLHPCGLREVRVFNVRDLEKLDSLKHAVRIAAGVSRRKREAIRTRAAQLDLKVL
ncbi:MAG: 50S ribosomal protein L32e [Candidatus Norongarragalinales archaeon]